MIYLAIGLTGLTILGIGLIVGFVLGATGQEKAMMADYIAQLERVSNLAEQMVKTREAEQERMRELEMAAIRAGQRGLN